MFLFQQINACIAASMSLKNSQKVRKMLEVSVFSSVLSLLHSNSQNSLEFWLFLVQ